MKQLNFLVTGTGRCGTVFMARVLTSLGIPCGHEAIFDYGGLEKAVNRLRGEADIRLSVASISQVQDDRFSYLPVWLEDPRTVVAESSYLAAPFLDSDFLKDVSIIHIVRNPVKVVNSFCNFISYFHKTETDEPYHKFIYSHLPDLANSRLTVYERGCLYYVLWNRMIERKLQGRKYLLYRAEDDLQPVLDFIGKSDVKREEIFSDRKINSFSRPASVFTLDQLPAGEIKRDFIDLGRRYGYPMNLEDLLI